MNFKNLSDENLHQKTVVLVREERKLTTEILHHLREISSRRLYAAMGYSSLWGYCTKELKYSEAAAQRRISAMKLIAEIPEVEQKINEGKLSLCTVSQIQSTCQILSRATPNFGVGATEQKRRIISSVEGKSKRQAEKILAAIAPQVALPERRRILNEKQTEVRFVVSEELEKKLERVKALTAHKKFNPSYAELIELMADLVLEKTDPEKKKSKMSPPPVVVIGKKAEKRQELFSTRPISKPLHRGSSRYVRVETERALFLRAGSRCEYVSLINQRRCEETKCLQVDHSVIPFAFGGTNDLKNLKLVCATHNRLRAIRTYGQKKMQPYLST